VALVAPTIRVSNTEHAVPAPLRLEPLALDHLPHVMTWVNDREVMHYFANRQEPIAEEAEHAYLATLLASSNDRIWSIFAGPDYLGQCSLNQIYWPARNGRLFLVVRREMQGRGHGRAALEQVLARAWGELGLHKVWLIVRRDNRRAQALYLGAGFDFEGVLRDEYRVGGEWLDMVRMSALAPGPRTSARRSVVDRSAGGR
jgi:diamine N-acetyltransferase